MSGQPGPRRRPDASPAPLWDRFLTWPVAWRVVACLLAWPFLLASRSWSRDGATLVSRGAAVVVAAVFGVPWVLGLAVLVSSGIPTLDDDPTFGEFTDDVFGPLDQPVDPGPQGRGGTPPG